MIITIILIVIGVVGYGSSYIAGMLDVWNFSAMKDKT